MSWHAEQLTHASSLNAITVVASVMLVMRLLMIPRE